MGRVSPGNERGSTVEGNFAPAPILCLQCQLRICLGLGCQGGGGSILPRACTQDMLQGGTPLLCGPLKAWGLASFSWLQKCYVTQWPERDSWKGEMCHALTATLSCSAEGDMQC